MDEDSEDEDDRAISKIRAHKLRGYNEISWENRSAI